MKRLVQWSIDHHWMVIVFSVLLLAAGLWTARDMPVDVLPEWMKFARGRDGLTVPVVLIAQVRSGAGFTFHSYGSDGRLVAVFLRVAVFFLVLAISQCIGAWSLDGSKPSIPSSIPRMSVKAMRPSNCKSARSMMCSNSAALIAPDPLKESR